MNIKEVIRFLPAILSTKLRPCFLGHTGIGKTEIPKQIAAQYNMDLVIIHVSQLEPSDFVGLYRINEDGRTSNCPPSWMPYKESKVGKSKITEASASSMADIGKIVERAAEGEINPNGGFIFLDEINRAHEDMRQALYQFLQDGRIHTCEIPQGTGEMIEVNGEQVLKLNDFGLPMGKYHILTAANPSSEGYETYEFDPALMNRLAWVNFTPEFEETRDYLKGKYGRSIVLSWVESNKSLIDYGSEFEIEGLLYSPRMTENHILLFNAVRKEKKEFQRKVYETIMQKEKVQAFMAYLEEMEFMNYVDVMNGLSGEKAKKLVSLLQDNRMDILSTITMDLADFFSRWEIGSNHKDIKDEKATIKNVTDFLVKIEDETFMAFLDGVKKAYNNPKSIIHQSYFKKQLKPVAKKYKHLFE